jgi:hypothetical protein
MAYHADVGYKPRETPQREDLELAEFWYFGALDTLLAETKALETEVIKLKEDGASLNERVHKVFSTLSKGEKRVRGETLLQGH